MELGRTEEAAPLYDRAVALLEQNDSAYDRSADGEDVRFQRLACR